MLTHASKTWVLTITTTSWGRYLSLPSEGQVEQSSLVVSLVCIKISNARERESGNVRVYIACVTLKWGAPPLLWPCNGVPRLFCDLGKGGTPFRRLKKGWPSFLTLRSVGENLPLQLSCRLQVFALRTDDHGSVRTYEVSLTLCLHCVLIKV